MKSHFSKNQLNRLPGYLYFLKKLESNGVETISCQTIATSLGLNIEQVRKDIALVSSVDGVPNKGRDVAILIKDIEKILGYDSTHNAVLVGVGSLGRAILNYEGFKDYGLNIVAAYDLDKSLINTRIHDIEIYDYRKIDETLSNIDARIGIISVPASNAQDVANKLMENGIEAIWNFAPVKLDVKENIILSNMDMAESLALLSHQLYLRKNKNKKGV